MYQITATVTFHDGTWTTTRQVPTFYLNENVQGITSTEHAEHVALTLLRTMIYGDGQNVTIHVSADKQ